MLGRLGGRPNAHVGFDDFDDDLTAGHARAQRYDPAFPVCLYVVSFGATPLLLMQLHDDGPMQGIR
jgi:hypothetical protein